VSDEPSSQRRLVYFADPMCSWCWGFAPVIEKIASVYGKELPISVVMGGLRAGNIKPMDQPMKNDIQGHWLQVHDRTGQKFNTSFFDRDGFVYDTAPACRAVVAVRRARPGSELEFLRVLHEAFYRYDIDLTSGPELMQIAIDFGFTKEQFAENFSGDVCSDELASDFNLTLQNGIRAFPALLGGSSNDRFMALTHGYKSFEELQPSLDRLISARQLPNGLMPGIADEGCAI